MRPTESSKPVSAKPTVMEPCLAGAISICAETTGTLTTVELVTPDGRLSLFAHEARCLADALNRVAIHVELEVAP